MTLAEQWLAQGEARGRVAGRAEGRASAIVAVLEARQKSITAEQRATIEACSDDELLDRWLRKAATLNDARELFEQPE